jgi:hypothetical protein
MKTIFVFILLMTTIPSVLFSQTAVKRSIDDSLLMRQNINFRVTNNNQVLSRRITTPETFQLRQSEKNAVAVTGKSVTKLDRNSVPILKDTATRSGVYMLPELYFAKEEGTNNQILYRILYVDSAPLRFDFGEQLYKGGIRFLPVETNYSAESPPFQKILSVPEEIIVSFGLEAIPLEIKHINWPPQDVEIKSKDPLDSLEIKILTITNPQGYQKFLPVEPTIFLSSARSIIQGFGLQTIPVAVALKGITSCKPVPVNIQASLGVIDPTNFSLSDNKPKEVNLRSESLGNIDLKVFNTTYHSNSISIKAIFPWVFLICALSGGIIGGIGNKLKNKEKITLWTIILGCIFGLIASVAYWGLGVNLLGISIQSGILNEAMVLGVGLVAGYFGLKLS